MSEKPLDWLDIALHTIPAILWALAAGYAAGFGWAYGGALGMALAILALAAGLGGVLFWITREAEQHAHAILSGRQSILEWAIPAIAQILAFGIGLTIGA